MNTKTAPNYPDTPELEKMKAHQPESQIIGSFLDWLTNEKNREICTWDTTRHREEFRPVGKTIEQTLAEYFDVDLKKVEEERRAVLEYAREINAQ